MKEGVWTLASCSKDWNFETIHNLHFDGVRCLSRVFAIICNINGGVSF